MAGYAWGEAVSAPIRSPNTGHSPGATDTKLLKFDRHPNRRLLAELRQCRRQFELRIPVTHLYHRTSYLQKLKRNLDRRLLAD